MRARMTWVVLVLCAAATWAQGPGPGDTPTGRQGYEWQTGINMAQDELRQLQATFEQLDEKQWMEEMVAWITYDFSNEGSLKVDESFRVAGIDAGKKADVQARETAPPPPPEPEADSSRNLSEEILFSDPEPEAPAAPPAPATPASWDITWAKRPPIKVTLTLTDDASTTVDCSLREATEKGAGYLGVFVHEGNLLCLARGPFVG